MKQHIKRDSSKTFCGRKYSIWRKGFTTALDRATNELKKKPVAKEELPTISYCAASCQTCIEAFNNTARIMAETGNLSVFIRIANSIVTQQKETVNEK
jgi:hypothetical protein